MYPIKQSTAETIPFFAHDVNGDGVTGLVDGGFTKRISKGSGAFAAMTVTVTEMENGWYSIPLTGTHSDTVGLLTVSLSHASTKRVNLQWRVSARTLDELASPTNITAATGIVLSGVTHTGAVIPTVTTTTTATNLTTNNDKSGYSLTAVTGLGAQTANITGNLIGTVSTVTAVTGLTAATVHADLDDIQARLPALLTAGGYMKSDALAINGVATTAVTTVKAVQGLAVDGVVPTVTAVTGLTAANLDAAISTRATPAQVNTEVVDALNVDTYAEPGQGAPGATITLAAKINYLYKAWRNKYTQTATEYKLYADDTTTVDQKAAVSDDATTLTRGEVATGL